MNLGRQQVGDSKNLLTENQLLQNTKQSLEADLALKQSEMSSLQVQRSTLQKQIAVYKSNIEDVKTNADKMVSQNQKQAYQSLVLDYEKKLASMTARLKQTQEQSENKKRALASTHTDGEILQRKLHQQDADITALLKLLADTEKKHDQSSKFHEEDLEITKSSINQWQINNIYNFKIFDNM